MPPVRSNMGSKAHYDQIYIPTSLSVGAKHQLKRWKPIPLVNSKLPAFGSMGDTEGKVTSDERKKSSYYPKKDSRSLVNHSTASAI